MVCQQAREALSAELRALVGDEDPRRVVAFEGLSSSASMQKAAPRVFESRQESTCREARSMMATR
jgi:hypothetical protein